MARKTIGLVLLAALFSIDALAQIRCKQVLKLLLTQGEFRAIKGFLPSIVRLKDLNRNLDFDEVRGLGKVILERYPPYSHVFLGLGRSPFLITSYIEKVAPGSTATVPLSYNDYIPLRQRLFPYSPRSRDIQPYSFARTGFRRKKEYFRKNLFSLLDRYVPSKEVLKDKKLVLVDFSDYGTSLANFYADITAWKTDRGIENAVEILFLNQREHKGDYWGGGKWERDLLKRVGHENAPWSKIFIFDDYPGIRKIWDERLLKPFAPYPHYIVPAKLQQKVKELPLNPAFETFERALSNDFQLRLKKDPSFAKEIKALRGEE